MIVSQFSDEDRRELARTFVTPGWALIQKEFELRKQRYVTEIVYGGNRAKDGDYRAAIAAMDMVVKLEKELFAQPEPQEAPFRIPEPERGDRY